jgi:hypothetical protein
MWLVVLLLPTMVTAAPPNFVRTLGALPPIFALPGVGVCTLTSFLDRQDAKNVKVKQVYHSERSEESLARRIDILRFAQDDKKQMALCLGVLAVILFGLILTVRDYFFRWPAHPEVQFVWQADLAAIARHLDSARDVPTDVAISGLSNETMDDDSLRLLMKRRDLAIRWFDSRTTLVVPSTGGRVFIPQIVPLDPILHARLTDWGAQEHRDPSGRFTWFDLSGIRVADPLTSTVLPSGRAIYLDTPLYNGMYLLCGESSHSQVEPGGELTALTYWQATLLPLPPLKAFVHLTDIHDMLIAQSDGLNAPSQFWRSGDIIVQLHRLRVPPDTTPGVYYWKVGLYNSQTQVRVQFKPTGDHLRLPDVEVRP